MSEQSGRRGRIGLITGFEPFAGLPTNPSARVLPAIDGLEIDGFTLATRLLPVSRARGPAMLEDSLDELQPAFVLSLGLASGAASIRVETTALNALDFGVADNDGDRPEGGSPICDGPAALRATIDCDAVVDAIEALGIPARLSFHAGGHLCNLTLYTALAHAARGETPTVCGFLHLPHMPDEIVGLKLAGNGRPWDLPSMSADLQVEAVRAAIRAIAGSIVAAKDA